MPVCTPSNHIYVSYQINNATLPCSWDWEACACSLLPHPVDMWTVTQQAQSILDSASLAEAIKLLVCWRSHQGHHSLPQRAMASGWAGAWTWCVRPWGGNSGLLGPVGVSGPRHVFIWIILSQRGQLSSERNSLFYGQWIINNLLKTTPQSLEICIFSLLATGSHYFLVHTILLLMAARCSFYPWTGCSQSQKSFWRGSRWKTKLSTGCMLQRLVIAGPKQPVSTGFSCWQLQDLQVLPFGWKQRREERRFHRQIFSESFQTWGPHKDSFLGEKDGHGSTWSWRTKMWLKRKKEKKTFIDRQTHTHSHTHKLQLHRKKQMHNRKKENMGEWKDERKDERKVTLSQLKQD